MKKIKQVFFDSIKQTNRHYEESKDIIARNNALLLMSISACGVLLVSILLLLTPMIIPTWHITIGHIMFLPFFVVFTVLGHYEYKHQMESESYALVHATVISFMVIIMALLIDINVVAYPGTSTVLVPLAMVALPVMFALPFHEIILYLCFVYFVFLQVNHIYTLPEVVQTNLFNGTAGLLIGIMASWINTNLRAEESRDRQEIVRISNQDKLTGIWNKSMAEKSCFNYLKNCQKEHCALIVIDIDNFKNVNDTLGHHGGDQVLAIFGELLNSVFRNSDIIGRVGGDEFLVLMKHVSSEKVVESKMRILSKAFQQEVFEMVDYEVTCSYGAVIKAEEKEDYLPMFEMADKILYRAKKNGKNQGDILRMSDCKELINKKKVMLIVDDSEVNRGVLKTIFGKDFEIMEACDGQQAMDIIEKHHSILDVMLLDIIMPGKDGFQVLQWMKHNHYMKQLPIAVISSDEASELKALQMGVSDMITKPFEGEVLRKRVENILIR